MLAELSTKFAGQASEASRVKSMRTRLIRSISIFIQRFDDDDNSYSYCTGHFVPLLEYEFIPSILFESSSFGVRRTRGSLIGNGA